MTNKDRSNSELEGRRRKTRNKQTGKKEKKDVSKEKGNMADYEKRKVGI